MADQPSAAARQPDSWPGITADDTNGHGLESGTETSVPIDVIRDDQRAPTDRTMRKFSPDLPCGGGARAMARAVALQETTNGCG